MIESVWQLCIAKLLIQSFEIVSMKLSQSNESKVYQLVDIVAFHAITVHLLVR